MKDINEKSYIKNVKSPRNLSKSKSFKKMSNIFLRTARFLLSDSGTISLDLVT